MAVGAAEDHARLAVHGLLVGVRMAGDAAAALGIGVGLGLTARGFRIDWVVDMARALAAGQRWPSSDMQTATLPSRRRTA